MRYLGNKTRLAKHLIPYLTEHLTGDNWYIEPFAGACGMISQIDYPNRIAADKDKYIIALMKAVSLYWTPPETMHEGMYKRVKANPDEYPNYLVGFIGYGCSYGGKWFAGMARGGDNKGKPRNHVAESSRNLVKMRDGLQGIYFYVNDYTNFNNETTKGNVVYCDPPYSTGTRYKEKFDTENFWQWVRELSKENYVYVSEYEAPEDFTAIWQGNHKSGIDNKAASHKPTVEKLYIHDDGMVSSERRCS